MAEILRCACCKRPASQYLVFVAADGEKYLCRACVVRMVNSFDALVASVESFLDQHDSEFGGCGCTSCAEGELALKLAKEPTDVRQP